MAPTEILARQHYNLATKIFKSINVNIELLTGKSDIKKKNLIRLNINLCLILIFIFNLLTL